MERYNVKALLNMALDYMYAEEEFRRFLHIKDCRYLEELSRDDYGKYVGMNVASDRAFYGLWNACAVVAADPDTVIATAKAINRYEKRMNIVVCNSFSRLCEERLIRFLTLNNKVVCYESTGRRKKWA